MKKEKYSFYFSISGIRTVSVGNHFHALIQRCELSGSMLNSLAFLLQISLILSFTYVHNVRTPWAKLHRLVFWCNLYESFPINRVLRNKTSCI